MIQSDPTVISTFTGAGGLDLGFEAAGFRNVGCIELNKTATETIRINRPKWKLLEPWDINRFARKISSIQNRKVIEKVDILIGGPPCQPFSSAAQWSQNGRNGLEDPRSKSLNALFQLAEQLSPKLILIENVPGFVSGKTSVLGFIERKIRNISKKTGVQYYLSWKVLNSADFGVPQYRRRAIVILTQNPDGFEWPAGTYTNDPVKAWDAIGTIQTKKNEFVPKASGKWADLLTSIPEGKNYLWHSNRGGGLQLFGYRTRYWSFLLKLAKNKPSWTLSAQPGSSTGPFHWHNRPLTTRELLRLQSFPLSWKVAGSYRQQVRQIGNAAPPLLAEILGRAVMKHLGFKTTDIQLRFRIPKKRTIPKAENISAVSSKYKNFVGDYSPHPGTGLGPNPRKE